jgi:hypothetical protein
MLKIGLTNRARVLQKQTIEHERASLELSRESTAAAFEGN